MLSGRNATLVIKSNAGKAEVNLNVELEDVSRHPVSPHQQPWNGPSRERRRLRRAAAQAAAQGAENVESIDEEVTTA